MRAPLPVFKNVAEYPRRESLMDTRGHLERRIKDEILDESHAHLTGINSGMGWDVGGMGWKYRMLDVGYRME